MNRIPTFGRVNPSYHFDQFNLVVMKFTNGTINSSANGVTKLTSGGDYPPHHSEPIDSTHSLLVHKTFERLQSIKRNGYVKINGKSLDIPSIVAVSRCAVHLLLVTFYTKNVP